MRTWTTEELSRLREMIEAGGTYQQIADAFNRTFYAIEKQARHMDLASLRTSRRGKRGFKQTDPVSGLNIPSVVKMMPLYSHWEQSRDFYAPVSVPRLKFLESEI